MRRGSRFLIGLAAALTYGGLMAFLGPRHFGHRGFYHYQAYRDDWSAHCHGKERGDWHQRRETPKEPVSGQSDSSNQKH